MSRTSLIERRFPRRQTGMTTILVSVLLLLIITIIVLFSSSVSVKEIRTGANQFRSVRANEVAQQGLSLGLEYIRSNQSLIASTGANGWLEDDLGRWEPCPANGVVEDDFPCDAERDPAERALLLRYRGPTSLPLAQRYRLPIAQPSGLPAVDINGDGTVDVSEAALRYRVGALLCRIEPVEPTPASPETCDFVIDTDDPTSPPQAYAVHVVARGAVMSANAPATAFPDSVDANGQPLAEARASVAQNFGSFRLLADGPDSPLIAANSVNLSGTFDIVANSNGGGFGIPLSIWTESVVTDDGTPKSCHIQEFLMTRPTDNLLIDGTWVCDQCQCPREGSLSYKENGVAIRGPDIISANENAFVISQQNFPDDLFEYLFGVPKVDSAGNERWTEVFARATHLDGTVTGDPLAPGSCADLRPASVGLFWSTEDVCDLPADVGTPLNPVFVVVEKNVSLGRHRFFGVIYKFSRPNDDTIYQLTANGAGTIYGALVADDNAYIPHFNGNFALVYSSEVMNNLSNGEGMLKLGPVPGSWTDLGTF